MIKTIKIICCGILAVFSAAAQQYSVSPIAGSALPPTPATAVSSSIGNTDSVTRDAAGNIYFASQGSVFKTDPNGTLTLVAGNGTSGYSGDGGPAVQASLSNPWGIAVDKTGNIYIADELNNRIRRVSPDGIITTVAGVGTAGFSGDGAAAVDAQLHFPLNVMLDPAGNLYIADYFNGRIRKVSPDGIIVTIAGGGPVYPADGGLATAAAIAGPTGMAIDATGNIFVADRSGNRVRKITANGFISTVAGTGVAGFSGDGALATDAQLYLPSDVAVDPSGNLFIADFNNNRIRKVTSAGIITSLPANYTFNGPSGVALDATGNLYIADRFNNLIQRLSTSGTATAVAGNGTVHFSGDGGAAVNALLNNVTSVAVDALGNLFIADSVNARVREVTPNGTISTFAGGGFAFLSDGEQATNARLVTPQGLAFDSAGNLYIADAGDHRVRKVSPGGIITTVAGNGTAGVSGDGGPAINAQLIAPSSVAADGSGNVYIVSQGALATPGPTLVGNSVRKVAPDGTITTLIPAPVVSGPLLSSQIPFSPLAVATDAAGDLFVQEATVFGAGGTETVQVLKISSTGATTTFGQGAGVMTVSSAGDLYLVRANTVQQIGAGGANTTSPINGTVGATASAIDGSGRIYVAQQYSVVRLQASGGTPSSVLISAVVDAASERAGSVSPGKIVVIYGAGLGPAEGVSAQSGNGVFGTNLSGASVTFGGVAAPILYASATQVTAVVPYQVTGQSVEVVATYQGAVSAGFPYRSPIRLPVFSQGTKVARGRPQP